MTRILALLASALLIGPAQDEPPPIEFKWNLQKGDRLDLKWLFSDASRHELPKLEGRTEADITETLDKREVEAELFVNEDTPAGTVLMTLKKIGWTQGTHEFECTLVWAEGRKPDVKTRIKVKDKASDLVKREQFAKSQAETTAETMKRVVEGTYALSATAGRPGETLVLRNNIAARGGNSIFDRLYLHSLAPRGSLSLNQGWKDPIEGVQLPPGLVEIDTLSWKITACGPKTGATAKAAFTFPINKSAGAASAGQVTDVRTTGTFSLAREYTFAAEGYLSGSKEDVSFNKKTDAKGKDADFYKDNAYRLLKQVLTVKMQKKPEEKKPPEEKK